MYHLREHTNAKLIESKPTTQDQHQRLKVSIVNYSDEQQQPSLINDGDIQFVCEVNG